VKGSPFTAIASSDLSRCMRLSLMLLRGAGHFSSTYSLGRGARLAPNALASFQTEFRLVRLQSRPLWSDPSCVSDLPIRTGFDIKFNRLNWCRL
jgi:hypothetical protein